VLITGASAGLGKESARVLASRGCTVVMAVRDVAKGQAVADAIQAAQPDALVEVMQLDLASLASVKAFSSQFCK
jgi:retinol dehydrogenase-12